MRWLVGGMALAMGLACDAGHQPGPRPDGIAPSVVVVGRAATLTIRGHFPPPVRADFSRQAIDADTAFTVELGADAFAAEFVDKAILRLALPPTLALGSYDVVVRDGRGRGGRLPGALTIVPVALDAVVIEDAPGGLGQEVGDQLVESGASLTLHAVGRAAGAFVAEVAVAWRVEGAIGELTPLFGPATVFAAGEPGSGRIVADLDGALGDITGLISVWRCAGAGECDNGDVCDGLEQCVGGRCQVGTPLVCADTDPCTAESCDPSLGCLVSPTAPVDLDGDGYAFGCGGQDCDDTPAPAGCGAACNPGILTDDDCDGYDNDCSGVADDGYAVVATCGTGWCATQATPSSCVAGVETPCAPGAPTEERLGAAGSCADGIDNDCDGDTDGADFGCGLNTPPLAALVVTPAAGQVSDSFIADASASTDREDAPAQLTFAWDLDGSGTFVPGGSTAAPSWVSLGLHRVSVQVTDSGALSSVASFEVLVVDGAALLDITAGDDVNDGTCDATHCSLREAVALARTTAGPQTIVVPPGTTVALATGLQITSDPTGVDLIGDGAVLDGAGIGANSACLEISGGSANVRVWGLEITNCPSFAVNLSGGTNVTVSRCNIHHNGNSVSYNVAGNTFGPGNTVAFHLGAATHGIQMNEPGLVVGNTFHDNTGWGIYLNHRRTAPTQVIGNQIAANAQGGIFVTLQCDANQFWHNTIHGNGSDGIRFGNDVGNEVVNNVISGNGGWGISGDDTNVAALHHNALFANLSGTCSGGASCTLGVGTQLVDPLYIDAVGGDWRLAPSSPLIDAGVELGVDQNGAAAGLFNGLAPDLGASETP